MIVRFLLVIVSIMAAALITYAQQTNGPDQFQAVPSELQPRYHFDFARNFYRDETAVGEDIAQLRARVAALEKLKGQVINSSANLLETLRLLDEIAPLQAKVDIYYYLRYAVNTEATDFLEKRQKLSAEIEPRLSFVRDELLRLNDVTLDRFIKELPVLANYRFAIARTLRLRAHTLSLAEEQLLAATRDSMTAWTEDLYQRAIDRVDFGEVAEDSGKRLNVLQDQATIENSSSRNVRAEGFKKYYAGYANSRDLFAFVLTKGIDTRNRLARLRGFESYPDQAFFDAYLDRELVESVYRQLAGGGEINKQFQRARVARIKQLMDYDDVNSWDMSVVPPGFIRPRFNVTQSAKLIEEALKPLGEPYGRELTELFNPANGRLDIIGGNNRTPGAFAWGSTGVTPWIFYAYNYEGFEDDLLTLAHEGGHVVHYQLIGNEKVLPTYTDGASYFTESFAMLNELIVADYLYQRETDPARKIYFLEEFLNNGMRLFRIASDAATEYAIYQGVQKEQIKRPEDLDAVTKKINSQFTIWYDKHDELKNRWNTLPHFYRSPMYYVNYVFANLLALKFFELYNHDQQNFARNYLALMRNGFNDTPAALLERFLKVDLKDPKLIEGGFAILADRTRELQRLYDQSSQRHQSVQKTQLAPQISPRDNLTKSQ